MVPWNKGKKLSIEHIKNLSISHTGYVMPKEQREKLGAKNEKHNLWKGNKVGYSALHRWLDRNFGVPNKCDNIDCIYPRKDSDGKLMIFPSRYEWSNKKGNYSRNREDWWMLCPSCHRKYDKIFNITRPKC
jgi:hypothetical protein